jgi:hypothetical protein
LDDLGVALWLRKPLGFMANCGKTMES